ncbi:hypothetical protein GYH30_055626, partial [Glycine max]
GIGYLARVAFLTTFHVGAMTHSDAYYPCILCALKLLEVLFG